MKSKTYEKISKYLDSGARFIKDQHLMSQNARIKSASEPFTIRNILSEESEVQRLLALYIQ